MPLDALILDVDGTLVDTNAHHVEAFVRTFADFGYFVPHERIAPEIGKGGDHLIPDVLGPEAEKKDGEAIRKALKKHFLDIAGHVKFAILPGALEIIDTAHQHGLKVALATSGEKEFLASIEKSCGASFSSHVDVVITSADAEKSKPSPDLLSVTLEKLDMKPTQCVLVGDTPHDTEAAKNAGLPCVGVEAGGHDAAELQLAGCRLVYADCAAIVADFDNFLKALS